MQILLGRGLVFEFKVRRHIACKPGFVLVTMQRREVAEDKAHKQQGKFEEKEETEKEKERERQTDTETERKRDREVEGDSSMCV